MTKSSNENQPECATSCLNNAIQRQSTNDCILVPGERAEQADVSTGDRSEDHSMMEYFQRLNQDNQSSQPRYS